MTVVVEESMPVVVVENDVVSIIALPNAVIPPGGTTNQVLTKNSNANFDLKWANGGSSGAIEWGGITGTLSNQTDLQAALNNKLSNPSARRMGLSIPPISGEFVTSAMTSATLTTGAQDADQITGLLAWWPQTFDIDRFGVSCTLADGEGRGGLYACDDNWLPTDLLLDTGVLDLTSTGEKTAAVTFTIEAYRPYWFMWHTSGVAQIRRHVNVYTPNLGHFSINSGNAMTVLERNLSFANGLPDPWNFVAGDIARNDNPPALFVRAV